MAHWGHLFTPPGHPLSSQGLPLSCCRRRGLVETCFSLPTPPPPLPTKASVSSKVFAQFLSRVQLPVTPRTVAHQAPLSMGFLRQGYWSRLPFPSQRRSPWPRERTHVSCIAGGLFTTEPPENPPERFLNLSKNKKVWRPLTRGSDLHPLSCVVRRTALICSQLRSTSVRQMVTTSQWHRSSSKVQGDGEHFA